jgi:hypothetical protein
LTLLEATEELIDLFCPKICSVVQLLVTLHWLSRYPTWDVLSSVWKKDVKTLQEYTQFCLLILKENLDEVILT